MLGELDFENTLTIRKSVIGHELISRNGLLEWFLYQNKFVEGYKNVIFSGTTVLELAILIEKYIIPRSELKGIINIKGKDGPAIIHGVQHIFHPVEWLKEWPDEDKSTRMVFITRDIKKTVIEEFFKIIG